MNTLADNALFEAFLCGRRQVTRVDVERAHSDLGWGAEDPEDPAPEVSPPAGPKAVTNDSSPPRRQPAAPGMTFEDTLNGLDDELAGVLKTDDSIATPAEGPPKDEPGQLEDLLVELVED